MKVINSVLEEVIIRLGCEQSRCLAPAGRGASEDPFNQQPAARGGP